MWLCQYEPAHPEDAASAARRASNAIVCARGATSYNSFSIAMCSIPDSMNTRPRGWYPAPSYSERA